MRDRKHIFLKDDEKAELFSFEISKRSLIYFFVLVIVSLIAFGVIRVAIQGYAVYEEPVEEAVLAEDVAEEPAQPVAEKQLMEEFMEDYVNVKVLDEMKNVYGQVDSCNQEKNNLISQNYAIQANLNDEIASLKAEISQLKDEERKAQVDVTDTEDNYAKFVSNVAVKICCKERVDRPVINSYSVVDGELFCLESGQLPLECP